MQVSSLNTSHTNVMTLKGFAVVFIVWGHHFGTGITHYLFSFNVPLLFFIVGLELGNYRKKSFVSEFKNVIKKILVPYFILSFVLYALWFLLIYLTGKAAEKGFSPVQEFLGIFYSQGMGQYMDWGMHMWYFPCLFIAIVLGLLTLKQIRNYTTVIVLSIVLSIVGFSSRYILNYSLPWSLDIAFIGQFFILTGYRLKNLSIKKLHFVVKLLVLTVLFTIGYVSQTNNVWIDMKQHVFGNIFLFSVSVFSSIMFYYLLSGLLTAEKIFVYIGRFFTVIFVFHLRIWTFLNIGFNMILPELNRQSAVVTLLFTGMQIAAVIIIYNILQKIYLRCFGKNFVIQN